MNRQPLPPDALAMANNPDWQSQWSRGLSAIATHGDLRPATAEALLAVSRLIARDLALAQLVEMLNPTGERSRWAVALELAGRLERFEATGWPRWRYSDRLPPDAIDRLLVAVMRGNGPRSARRLFDLLRESVGRCQSARAW